jgi:hypothetical protein
MVHLGACPIAGIRLALERQVNVRELPTGKAIEESVDLTARFSTGCSAECLTESNESKFAGN